MIPRCGPALAAGCLLLVLLVLGAVSSASAEEDTSFRFLHVDAGPVYSSNPGYDVSGDEHPGLGAFLGLHAGSTPDGILRLGGKVECAAFGGTEEESYVEAEAFVGWPMLLSYSVVRSVKPSGLDLAGLHPRVGQAFDVGLFGYTYRLIDRDFEEASMGALDSRDEMHILSFKHPLGESGILEGICWVGKHDRDGLNDYEDNAGLIGLTGFSNAGDYLRSQVRLGAESADGLSTIDLFLGSPSWAIVAGWHNMHGFDGPMADPNREVPAFVGFAGGSVKRGDFTAALAVLRVPQSSYVSNYQILTSAGAGLSVDLRDAWKLGVTLGHEEADRSTGPDLSRRRASARAEWRFAESWRVTFGIEWQERSSDDPGEEYDNLSLSLGLCWNMSGE